MRNEENNRDNADTRTLQLHPRIKKLAMSTRSCAYVCNVMTKHLKGQFTLILQSNSRCMI